MTIRLLVRREGQNPWAAALATMADGPARDGLLQSIRHTDRVLHTIDQERVSKQAEVLFQLQHPPGGDVDSSLWDAP